MQTVNISDFRANLLKYLEIANSGELIGVTSNGKLLATITPPVNQKEHAKQQFKVLSTSAKVHDLKTSTGCKWSAIL